MNSINNSQELKKFKLFLKEYKENEYQPTKFQWQYVQLNQ